ncbi:hypothetical protein THAOC_15214 [Thalassiosira oceanica]|uniref:SIS domain-containing protein n=1 Tax=Thalassiosira oceanica TaxID=159749 RepID=K0SFE2_THAOC|nr:hypothetical protein THAOC_15214 [Thalassiosira oceanica]|eukprot:EJK64085.1 hypothetical protein THAOC_15214 [Thalassiosira oceanica]
MACSASIFATMLWAAALMIVQQSSALVPVKQSTFMRECFFRAPPGPSTLSIIKRRRPSFLHANFNNEGSRPWEDLEYYPDDHQYHENHEADDHYNGETNMAGNDVGGFNPEERLGLERQTVNVGDPQTAVITPMNQTDAMNITNVLSELQAIQSQGPKKYCILGTRHCSFLHQQIVEMLAYALVLSGNHIYTSGSQGTNAAAIKGALRACQPQLLTVVLPQSMSKQTPESQELLEDVTNLITMPQNDEMPLDVASRICNSHLLSQTDQLVSFAFHESNTVLEAAEEAKKLEMLVTLLYLD